MHSPVLGVQAAGPPGRPGFADVEDYLRVRRVAEGWSLQQMVAELHVASAWLEREMDQLQIPRPRSVEVASIVMGASRPLRVKLDPRLGRTEPSGCSAATARPSVISVAAFPMSIWPQAMPKPRPSSAGAGHDRDSGQSLGHGVLPCCQRGFQMQSDPQR